MNAVFNMRASSLGELFDCPARWESKHINGLRLPSGAASRLGTAIHEATTLNDFAVLSGTTVAIDDCESVLVDAIWNPEEEVDWTKEEQQTAETTGRALVSKYITDIAPTQNYVGVEVAATPLTLSDIGITLTGTIDRIYQNDNGLLGIGDIKTGKTVCSSDGLVKTAGHGTQMGIYNLLAENALDEPITLPARIYGLTTGKTTKGQHIGIGEIPEPMDALLGNSERQGLLHHAGQILKNGLFFGNPKSMLCNEKYCPAFHTCSFRK